MVVVVFDRRDVIDVMLEGFCDGLGEFFILVDLIVDKGI